QQWDKPIVTEITPIDIFFEAEEYHHNYYNNHATQPYCQTVISPKLAKLYKEYSSLLKPVKIS
ncbi:MAG TPA: peptide-methionine (S)-S-oxide reductase, partial [Methylophaga sp.]|nr:peptide-methionine (S)-S-oxide reductase [Methylophaga sp.]